MSGLDRSPDGFYRRLDVGPEASREEIVHAYRRLAHGAHPDIHPGDPDAARRFREITEAYEVLADPFRRANYDRSRAVRPIRVVVRPAEARPSESRWSHNVASSGPAVFLGAASRPPADAQLRAGPARVHRPSRGQPIRDGGPEQALVELMARLLDTCWRH
jgi:curved DNA-binding protein CbpA